MIEFRKPSGDQPARAFGRLKRKAGVGPWLAWGAAYDGPKLATRVGLLLNLADVPRPPGSAADWHLIDGTITRM